jgi:hypothetical protein
MLSLVFCTPFSLANCSTDGNNLAADFCSQAYWGVVLSQWAGSHLKAPVKELLSWSRQFCSQIWGAEKQLGQQNCWIGKANMCMVKTLTWCATLVTVSSCWEWNLFGTFGMQGAREEGSSIPSSTHPYGWDGTEPHHFSRGFQLFADMAALIGPGMLCVHTQVMICKCCWKFWACINTYFWCDILQEAAWRVIGCSFKWFLGVSWLPYMFPKPNVLLQPMGRDFVSQEC